MEKMPADAPMENPPPPPLAGLDPADLLRQGAAADTFPEAPFEPPSLEELAEIFPQFEILELIGRGGMGAVYKVRQPALDRVVALKILPPAISATPGFSDRFTREARTLAKLNHPGIVTIHEFGQAGGLHFILMEYVDGANLRQLMATRRIEPREALSIVPQICDALQYAHDQGVIHRDIKPENLLLDRRGRVKVADFGIAKLVAADTSYVVPPSGGSSSDQDLLKEGLRTEAGKLMGTPQYMAPEQIEHPGNVDHRADIYALGVVFYQMLTGELPGRDLQAPFRKARLDVRLDEIVLQAMERNPELRYQQVSVLKTRVEDIGGGIVTSAASHPAPTTDEKSSIGRWVAICGGLALVLGLPMIILGWYFASLTSRADHSRAPLEKLTAAEMAEPPRLRFIAWSDEWEMNKPGIIRHPDGSPVTDPSELELLAGLPQPYSGASVSEGKRNLYIWVSHPRIDQIDRQQFHQPGAANEEESLDWGARYPQASAKLENLVWRAYQIEVDDRHPLNLRMDYAIGPLEKPVEFPVEARTRRSLSLENGGGWAVIGQNVDGESFVSIHVEQKKLGNRRFAVEAVTHGGAVLRSRGRSSSIFPDGRGNEEFFFSVPISEVAKFLIGTRPMKTVVWNDVAKGDPDNEELLRAIQRQEDKVRERAGVLSEARRDGNEESYLEAKRDLETDQALLDAMISRDPSLDRGNGVPNALELISLANDYLDCAEEAGVVSRRYGELHPARIEAERKFAVFKERNPTSPDATCLEEAKRRLRALEATKLDLAQRYLPTHPKVTEVQARIDTLEAMLKAPSSDGKPTPLNGAEAPPAAVVTLSVLGEVANPGVIRSDEPVSLLDVLASAGGWTKNANLRKVTIRFPDQRSEIHDVSSILRGAAVNPAVPDRSVVTISPKSF